MQVAKARPDPVRNLLAGGKLIQETQVTREELLASGRLVELPLEGYAPAAAFSRQPFVSRGAVVVTSQPVMTNASTAPVTIADKPLVIDRTDEPIVEAIDDTKSSSTSSTKKGRLALLKGLRSGEVSKIVDTMEAAAIVADPPTMYEDVNVVPNSDDLVMEAAKAEALAREELEQAMAAQQLAEAEALAQADSEQRLAALAAQGLVEEPSPDVAPVKGLAGRLARAGFAMN